MDFKLYDRVRPILEGPAKRLGRGTVVRINQTGRILTPITLTIRWDNTGNPTIWWPVDLIHVDGLTRMARLCSK